MNVAFLPCADTLPRLQAGSRPGGRGTFLCFAKAKYPKERRAEVRAPAGYLALLAAVGVGLNSLRSNNARPDPPAAALLSPATRHGGPDSRDPTAEDRTAEDRTAEQGHAMARPCGVRYGYSVSPAVMRRRVAQGAAEKEAQMFERSEFLRFPPVPSNAACPRSGSTNPARLLFAYFLLAKQEKVSALPGAHPGNATPSGRNPEEESQTC